MVSDGGSNTEMIQMVETGGVSVETFFQGQANSWYQGWVWTDAQAYGDGGGPLGFGASSIKFNASVPWMLFT